MSIELTIFPNQSALSKSQFNWDFDSLAMHLENSSGYRTKSECPWIKLAIFGSIRTAKQSLRHDKNVVAITGAEGDYDGGQVTLEQAKDKLEKAGVKAILYSSPSHRPDFPRWRVLVFTSKPYPPHMRMVFIGRLNGVLGGILSPESFVLSQSYYYGKIDGADFEFETVEDGDYIDELDELDEIAIFKKPVAHKSEDGGADYSLNMFDLAVQHYGRKLQTGDNRRELLKSYIASRSGKGLVRDEVLTLVKGAIDRYFDPKDPVDEFNIEQIATHFADQDSADQPVNLEMLLKSLSGASEKRVERSIEVGHSLTYPKPYRGVMEAIVDSSCVSAFKPQPELATLSALIAMASCINGEYSTASGGRFNLYGIGSLQSGGGKDNPRSMAEMVVGLAGGEVIGKPTSGAALEDRLRPWTNQLVSVDEMSFMLQASNDEKAPSYLKDLVAVMLKLYSASRGGYNKRSRAMVQGQGVEHTMVMHPCVSILGFSTPEGFAQSFSQGNLKDGLIGRMLFVEGRPDVRPKRPLEGMKVHDTVVSMMEHLSKLNPVASAGMGASVGGIVVGETKEANQLLESLLENCEFDRDRSIDGAPALYARSFEKIERISGVLAIWEDPTSPQVEVEHVQWAKQMVYASDSAILNFVEKKMVQVEGLEQVRVARDFIKRILKKEFSFMRPIEKEAVEAGLVSRSQLLRVSKMKARDFNDALTMLQDMGELKAFDEKGKKDKFISNIDLLE